MLPIIKAKQPIRRISPIHPQKIEKAPQTETFSFGRPHGKDKALSCGAGLEIERAITPAERRKTPDAADILVEIGGRSRDRARYSRKDRPGRKSYRPFRNRAIICALIETGMRRAAVVRINAEDVNFDKRRIAVEEKGGLWHQCQISAEGLEDR